MPIRSISDYAYCHGRHVQENIAFLCWSRYCVSAHLALPSFLMCYVKFENCFIFPLNLFLVVLKFVCFQNSRSISKRLTDKLWKQNFLSFSSQETSTQNHHSPPERTPCATMSQLIIIQLSNASSVVCFARRVFFPIVDTRIEKAYASIDVVGTQQWINHYRPGIPVVYATNTQYTQMNVC